MLPQVIKFHDQKLVAVMKDNQPYIAMKPITENLGLSWVGQLQRIKRHKVLNRSMCIIHIVAQDGKKRELMCLPLSMLNGWLFGIDINRAKPELRDRLEQYQLECFDVLFRHFMPKANHGLSPEHQRHIQKRVSELAKQAGNSYKSVYGAIKDEFKVGTYKDIADNNYPALCAFLDCKPLEGQYIAHEKEQIVTLSIEDIYHLTWLCFASIRLREGVEYVTPALNILGSKYHDSFFSMWFEYKSTINKAKAVVLDKLKQFGFPETFEDQYFPSLP